VASKNRLIDPRPHTRGVRARVGHQGVHRSNMVKWGDGGAHFSILETTSKPSTTWPTRGWGNGHNREVKRRVAAGRGRKGPELCPVCEKTMGPLCVAGSLSGKKQQGFMGTARLEASAHLAEDDVAAVQPGRLVRESARKVVWGARLETSWRVQPHHKRRHSAEYNELVAH
jgi:hypothetical protein